MQKLLIVEDDPSLRRLYEAEFAEEGYDVRAASSAEAAVEEVRRDPPDAIVLDIRLPGRNGLELLRDLLESRPETAVVLNSAYPGYKSDFACWSADGYVVKSSDTSELKATLAGALRSRARAA